MIRSWAETVGREALGKAVEKATGRQMSGVAFSKKEQKMASMLRDQHRALESLASMLDFFLTNEEVAKLDGMFNVITDMSKTFGLIVGTFDLDKPKLNDDDAVDEAQKIIDESRESEGGTDESN